jgi:hypothetical protein
MIDDAKLEAWMGQMQAAVLETNRKLSQVVILLTPADKPQAAPSAPAAKLHIEHPCPSCGKLHSWDLTSDTLPGSAYAEGDPPRFPPSAINEFLGDQMCERCITVPLTWVPDAQRAAQPVLGVADIYGIKK